MMWRAVTAVAAAIVLTGAEGSSDPAVLLMGTLRKQNSELNLINGGETIVLRLQTDGPNGPVKFIPTLLTEDEVFSAFVSDFAHSPGESGFIRRLPHLLKRQNATLSPDKKTLTLLLTPDPGTEVLSPEVVYLQIPHTVIDCRCSYRIPVLEPLLLVPMEAPMPRLVAPSIVCSSRFKVSAVPVEPPIRIIGETYTVEWVVSEGAEVEDPEARETVVHGVRFAGMLNITVSFSLRDDRKSASMLVERVESPLPAEVSSSVMHVAGTTAVLNARRVIGGGPEAYGEWTVLRGDPEVTLSDPRDPEARITSLGDRTVLVWKVVGHAHCPVTRKEVELRSVHARVLSWDDEVCGNSHRIVAEAPGLDRIRGEWSVELGGESIEFVPGATHPAVTAVGLQGTTLLRWTLHGDGGSAHHMDVAFTRKHEPRADIITTDPKAYIGSPEVPLEAAPPGHGRGRWIIKQTTCDPAPFFSHAGEPRTVMEGLQLVRSPCRVEVQWEVENPPCPPAVSFLSIAVVPEPPTTPEVGPPIILCQDSEVKLTGNEAVVGNGFWEAVEPADLKIPNPTNPNALLPFVREGETVLRWTITNGKIEQHATLLIRRHAIPEAVVKQPASPSVTFCGASFTVEADNSHFGAEDYGRWSVLQGSARCESGDEKCFENREAHLVGLARGPTTVRWTTRSTSSETDCPDGNAVALTLHSWQLPQREHTEYTTNPTTTLRLGDILEKACADDPTFYPRYVAELAALQGQWAVDETASGSVRVLEPTKHVTKVIGLPLGTTKLRWVPTECRAAGVHLTVLIEHGRQLECRIEPTGGGHLSRSFASAAPSVLHIVGPSVKLSVGKDEYPVSAFGTWSSSGDVYFSHPRGPATTVKGIPPGDTVITFKISAGVEAFAGVCRVVVRSLVAKVAPARRTVCYDVIEIEAIPPIVDEGDVPGLTSFWRVPMESGLVVESPRASITTLSNLRPGRNVAFWRVELNGNWDEVAIEVVRDVLVLPFGAESLTITKRVINMQTLRLPWEKRPEWPEFAGDWSVSSGASVRYDDEAGEVVLSGIAPKRPARFEFEVMPGSGSTCVPGTFVLEVVAISTQVLATTVQSECDLLRGATIEMIAGEDLEWKEGIEPTDLDGLRSDLGPVLGPALLAATKSTTDPRTMVLRFAPVSLAGDPPEPLRIRNVRIPHTLLSSHVVTSDSATLSFLHPDGLVCHEFTVWPIQASLTLNGKGSVTEKDLNDAGGELAVTFTHVNLTRLGKASELAARVLGAISSKTKQAGAYGWNARKPFLLDANTTAVTLNTVQTVLRPDEWYTIGEHEFIHYLGKLADLCMMKEAEDEEVKRTCPEDEDVKIEAKERKEQEAFVSARELRSKELKIHDTRPKLVVEGAANECDFESRGAEFTVRAIGLSFLPGAEVHATHFRSNRADLETGWDAVAVRGLLNTTSLGASAKTRTLSISPTGPEVYEIPQGVAEVLSFAISAEQLIHPPHVDQSRKTRLVEAEGNVTISDTYIEVVGGIICADALRESGHTLTLNLFGDTWSSELNSSRLGADLVGAMSSRRDLKNGWETAMLADVLPNEKYRVTLLNPGSLEIRFPPLPSYLATQPEEVGIRIPGASTSCSKCLEHSGVLHIYHAHNVVPSSAHLRKAADFDVTLTLPCARFATGLTSEHVRNAFKAVVPIRNGFDTHKESIISSQAVHWVDNQTVRVAVRWPSSLNTSVPENITIDLNPTAVVPATGERVSLTIPVLISPTPPEYEVGWFKAALLWWWFLSPLLLFATFADLMQMTSPARYLDRLAAHAKLPLRSMVVNTLLLDLGLVMAMALSLDTWISVTLVRWLHKLIGVVGAAAFGALVLRSDFLSVRSVRAPDSFSLYINLLSFFALGSTLWFGSS